MVVNARSVAMNHLYDVFSVYPKCVPFSCTFCHSEAWQIALAHMSLSDIDASHGYTLVTEVADHWSSREAFCHFLPRMLELMGKPHFVDTLAPELMLEKLASMDFSSWHRNEQDAVNRILEILTLEIPFECDEDRAEWKAALALLNVAESF